MDCVCGQRVCGNGWAGISVLAITGFDACAGVIVVFAVPAVGNGFAVRGVWHICAEPGCVPGAAARAGVVVISIIGSVAAGDGSTGCCAREPRLRDCPGAGNQNCWPARRLYVRTDSELSDMSRFEVAPAPLVDAPCFLPPSGSTSLSACMFVRNYIGPI